MSHAQTGWRVNRVELRSPVSDRAWPIARVELDHPTRGRVTEIASAPGALDAAFAAAGLIVGIAPTISRYSAQSLEQDADGLLTVVEVVLSDNGVCGCGDSRGSDLIKCSLEAWLKAADALRAALEPRMRARPDYPVRAAR